MITSRRFSDRLVDVVLYLLLVLLAVACLVPFLHVISVSLSSYRAVSAHEVGLWPIERGRAVDDKAAARQPDVYDSALRAIPELRQYCLVNRHHQRGAPLQDALQSGSDV